MPPNKTHQIRNRNGSLQDMVEFSKMKRWLSIMGWLSMIFVIAAANGCGKNPKVEGARLDLRNKDYQRALTNINEALLTDPDNAEAYSIKGDILFELLPSITNDEDRTEYVGELTGAYAQALLLEPSYHSHIESRRLILYKNELSLGMEAYKEADLLGGRERANRFNTAARHFRNASMISPDSSNAHINEAHAFYNAGEAKDAADAYEAAISSGNTDRELFIYLARTYELIATELADPETQSEFFREIIRTLSAALSHHPEDDEIRKLLLNAYAISDLDEEALPFFKNSYSTEKDNKIFLYNYGTLLLRMEDYEGAITMLSDAVSLDSSYVNALFNLGAAYVNRGVAAHHSYRAVQDSLSNGGRMLAPSLVTRLEARKIEIEQSRNIFFGQAIRHLESVRRLQENDSADLSSVCRALYVAYYHMNQRSRAEEASICSGT